MAWGYRLETLHGAEAARCRQAGKVCAVRGCEHTPQYLSGYRYVRANGKPVTVRRPLCVKHARLFSMKYTLAWPHMLRRVRRPLVSIWAAEAAA